MKKNKKGVLLSLTMAMLFFFQSLITSFAAPQLGDIKPNNLPSSMTLWNINRVGEEIKDYDVGTVINMEKRRKGANVYVNENGVRIRNGSKAIANVHPDTRSRNYICIESGITANWGGNYNRKEKYSASHSFTKIISYAKYRGWDEITIQALIWKNLDQVRLNSKYQNLYNQYSNELKKDPNSNKFKGATVYEYRSPTRPNTQHLIGYSYAKPNAEITINKWEQSKKIYTGGNPTFAINQAGKALYSLNGAQYGIYKTYSDAQAKRNPYKTVTLSGDNPSQAKFTLPANSTYYGREIKAPAKGYYINDEVFTISTHSGNKTIHVTEIPKTDPMRIVINKTDTKGNGLKGAKFEVRYYNQMLTKAQAENATPTKRWIYESDKYGKVELNNKAHKIGGDTLYMDAPDGNVIGLYGTYTVREIEAPEGFIPSSKVAWGQVKEGSSRLILGFENNSNKLSNESQKGKIGIAKTDKETGKGLTGIKFNVKLLESYDSASDVKAGTVVDTIKKHIL